MLVLSRQRDETIMIGDDVQITIVDIRGDKVRLGITAPRHIQVHRKEVYDAIKRENQQAAKLSTRDVADIVERDAEKKKPNNASGVTDRIEPGNAAPDKESDQHKKETGENKELANPNRSDHVGQPE